jgi:hypothetical protein
MKVEGTLKMITKTLIGAAIVLGSVLGAAPAGADPTQSDTHPNPFGSLTASVQQTAPAGSPAPRDEIERGLQGGLSHR